MADIKTVKDLMAAIRETERTTKAYDTTAEVTRVAGSTAWVHIPGGVDETPVMLSIDAKAGDTVNVRVSGGKAWITGNNTNPPTNDKETVRQIYKIANNAQKQAAAAEESALNSITEDIMHYLVTDQDEGVTIETEGWTDTPQTMTETDRYLWIYHTYTLANGKTLDTVPVIVGVYGEEGPQGEQGPQGETGATGATGPAGRGISSVQPQYRLSTSPTSLVGGTWSTTLEYSSGYYIWTRTEITYTDGTVGYSTAIYDEALTEACSLSYNTAQYFWVKESGGTTAVPTGAYVTETPRDTYESSPTLGSLLLRSAGIYIRLAAVTIAQFLSSGLTLFSSGGNKLAEFLSSGLTVYNGNDSEVAHLGFGSTKDASGTINAPYATFGYRKANSDIGAYSVAEGQACEASGTRSHAEGYFTTASGHYSHSEGYYAKATNDESHAEGNTTTSSGWTSHAEGYYTKATGNYSHSEGRNTEASGLQSHAGGLSTIAGYSSQTVIGKYNSNSSSNVFEIGWGSGVNSRANIFEVDNSGNTSIGGDIKDMSGNVKYAGINHTHSGYVSKITSMPSYTAPTLNASTQFTRSAGGYYRQSGQGVVFVNINIKTKAGISAVNSNIKVFTGLPAPTFYTTLAAYVGGNSGGCIPCFINDSGELYLRANILNIPADTGVYITGVYISNVFS